MYAKFFIIIVLLFIALIIIKIALPMYRFMLNAETTIHLYDNVFKIILRIDFSKVENVKVTYGKYKFEFSNTNEASIEFEKMIKEALDCYDKLGDIGVMDDELKAKKDRLIEICSEVRTMRWKNKDSKQIN